jgi:hypothetical protein
MLALEAFELALEQGLSACLGARCGRGSCRRCRSRADPRTAGVEEEVCAARAPAELSAEEVEGAVGRRRRWRGGGGGGVEAAGEVAGAEVRRGAEGRRAGGGGRRRRRRRWRRPSTRRRRTYPTVRGAADSRLLLNCRLRLRAAADKHDRPAGPGLPGPMHNRPCPRSFSAGGNPGYRDGKLHRQLRGGLDDSSARRLECGTPEIARARSRDYERECEQQAPNRHSVSIATEGDDS